MTPSSFKVLNLAKTKDLEAAGIGQDRTGPVHEAVQTSQGLDDFHAGTQEKMIGVRQDDLRAQSFKLFRGHSLDCGLGAHRHKNRGLHHAPG